MKGNHRPPSRPGTPIWLRIVLGIERDENGCWNWQRTTHPKGYGYITIARHRHGGRRSVMAHQVSYEAFVGKVPGDLQIDHLCRNKRCVNPAHLEAVTPVVNNRRALIAQASAKPAFSVDPSTCPWGHPQTSENMWTSPSGLRWICRVCRRERRLAVAS